MTRDRSYSFSAAELDHRRSIIEPLRFLFEIYEPKYWYWELVDTMQRLTLTGFLAIINPGSSEQVIFAAVISLIYVRVYMSVTPYCDTHITACKEIILWQLFVIYALVYLMRHGFFNDQSVLLAIAIIVTATVNIIFEFWSGLYNVRDVSNPRPTEIDKCVSIITSNLSRAEQIAWYKAQLERVSNDVDHDEQFSLSTTENVLNNAGGDDDGTIREENDIRGNGRAVSSVQMSSCNVSSFH